MTIEVWLALIGLSTTIIGASKYMVTQIRESNKETVKAHEAHIASLKKVTEPMDRNYHDVVSRVTALTNQTSMLHKEYTEIKKHLVTFIDLTRASMKDMDRYREEVKNLKDNFGKVHLKVKK